MQFPLTSTVMGCYSLLSFSKGYLTAKYLNSIDVSGNCSLNILKRFANAFSVLSSPVPLLVRKIIKPRSVFGR